MDYRESKGFSEKKKKIYHYFIDYAKTFYCLDQDKLWKVLREMGIPDHLTCLLRNLYADQEATVRTLYEITDWFKIEKGVQQGCLLSPCLFNLYSEYMMRNVRLDELQARIKIGGKNINNLSYADGIHSNGRKRRGTKKPLDEGEGGE